MNTIALLGFKALDLLLRRSNIIAKAFKSWTDGLTPTERTELRSHHDRSIRRLQERADEIRNKEQ